MYSSRSHKHVLRWGASWKKRELKESTRTGAIRSTRLNSRNGSPYKHLRLEPSLTARQPKTRSRCLTCSTHRNQFRLRKSSKSAEHVSLQPRRPDPATRRLHEQWTTCRRKNFGTTKPRSAKRKKRVKATELKSEKENPPWLFKITAPLHREI